MSIHPYSVEDKSVVIVGAGGAIGRAVSHLLAQGGAHVVCADVDGNTVQQIVHDITAAGGSARSAQVDARDPGSLVALVEQAASLRGRIDGWCNVAGLLPRGRIESLTAEDLDAGWRANVVSTVLASKLAAIQMRETGGGSIVNFASQAIDEAAPALSLYSMTKAAVTQFTKVLAAEFGEAGVRANVVAPGYLTTPMTEAAFLHEDGSVDVEARAAGHERFRARIPLGRLGQPEDIGPTVQYLLSDASAWTTGQILRPNGGATMPW